MIDDCKLSFICLVIPFLSNDLILGNDFLLKNGVILDYCNINIKLKNRIIPKNLVLFERDSSEKLILSKNEETTCIYLVKIKEIIDLNNENKIVTKYLGVNDTRVKVNKNVISDKHVKEMKDKYFTVRNIDNVNDKHVNKSGNIQHVEYLIQEISHEILNKCKNNNINTVEKESNFLEQCHSTAESLTILSCDERDIFYKLLLKYKSIFSDRPGCTIIDTHRIKLINKNPIINKSYPVPYALRNTVAECLNEMLESKVIERATSPHCNPLRIVKKADGKIRVCLDARNLNKFVDDDNEAPPLIADLMQKFYSSYYQIELHEESRSLSAFLFNGITYQFTRVPFGLKTAGSAFIRAFSLAFVDFFQKSQQIKNGQISEKVNEKNKKN